MKIAAILDYPITAGGGFNQALNAIVQMARICDGKYDFVVYTYVRKDIDYLRRLGIQARTCKSNTIDTWLAFATPNHLLRRIQSRLKWIGGFEKMLLSDDVDLVYFVAPSLQCLSLQRLNYMTTVWDLCHRDTPEFPEVRNFNIFLAREYLYTNTLSQAVCVLADSEILCNRIARRYGVDRERLIAMPYAPAPFVDEQHALSKEAILSKYKIAEGYFFYPAQFWAHKNHIRLLQALQILKQSGIEKHLVFCGSNKENHALIASQTKALDLEELVHFLGFVDAEDIRGLYEGCSAVVMPSYFGPTNLPPLEAWKLGRPLIYSAHLSEQVGDAALLVDPDSPQELAEAMRRVLDADMADHLVKEGRSRLQKLDQERAGAEETVSGKLAVFFKRLECWKAPPLHQPPALLQVKDREQRIEAL